MLSELAATVLLATTLLVSTAGLLRAEWDRVRCSHLAFEAAHRARISSEDSNFSSAAGSQTRVQRTETGVIAQARCGNAQEEVRLPYLEEARW